MSGMEEAVEREKPDLVLHLGDHLQDAQRLSGYYPKLPLVAVPGNCDGWTSDPLKRQLTLEGHTLLMSHGHLWQVKSGYDAAIWEARQARADILLFGHTHSAYCEYLDGLWVMNPGTAWQSYGTILLDGAKARCFLSDIQ